MSDICLVTLEIPSHEELERCIVEGISDYEIVLCSNPIISLAKEILSYPNTTCKTSYSSISEESEWRSIPIEDLIEKLLSLIHI